MLLKDLKVRRGAPELDPDPTGPTRARHCHIVQHADQGIMTNILVVDARAPPPNVVICQPPSD